MQAYDPEFTSAAHKLLQLIDGHQLSTPLAISWRKLYGAPPTLYVHVDDELFKSWLDELDGAVLSSSYDDDEHAHHMHAEGALKLSPDVRMHLVAVTHLAASS